mmetsp:Transcript_90407/g.244235  ORF Transcript_90407/g.244235 Transcript_90407/m.244235 type:complete len:109 (+) Transcript_90407:86-412(+)
MSRTLCCMCKPCSRFFGLRATWTSFSAAALSGAFSAVVRYLDVDLEMNFLEENLPDGVVFNVFVTFTSLVIAFRTSHALTRYTDGAKLIHTLSASWFDATSALLATRP